MESKELAAFYPHDAHTLQRFANQAGVLLTVLSNSEQLADAQNVIGSMWAIAAVGDKAGNILHNFKNPIIAISSIVQEIREKCPKELCNQFLRSRLDSIYDSSVNATDDLEKFYRGVAGKPPQEDELIEINPANSVIKVLGSFQQWPSNIEIEKKFRRHIPNIKTLPGFNEIIRNLVKNALTAMATTGGSLTVIVEPFRNQREGGCLEGINIIIEDTGPGIPPERLHHIFNFNSAKGLGNGTSGFGLWWTKQFLNRVGGDIFVEFARTKGAKFTVFHPIIPRFGVVTGNM